MSPLVPTTPPSDEDLASDKDRRTLEEVWRAPRLAQAKGAAEPLPAPTPEAEASKGSAVKVEGAEGGTGGEAGVAEAPLASDRRLPGKGTVVPDGTPPEEIPHLCPVCMRRALGKSSGTFEHLPRCPNDRKARKREREAKGAAAGHEEEPAKVEGATRAKRVYVRAPTGVCTRCWRLENGKPPGPYTCTCGRQAAHKRGGHSSSDRLAG